ncbi:MAG: type III polyketide synthase [Bacteroidetes bacterium]|nr:type III polyketide synthase [Bacteroidota bacterium]
MSYILNISTAVPEFKIENEELINFYSKAVATQDPSRFEQKINFLNRKTKIESRFSCIPDYKGSNYELFNDHNYKQPVEKRMEIYNKKILPLASTAIDRIFAESDVTVKEVTHLITVSCTGLIAPGLEFLVAEQYGLQHTEKIALNFLGCYAALKALKYAHHIATSDPDACILIVSAELCSLHFYPSDLDEDIIANLLFADGAAAVLMCGDKNKHIENNIVLQIDDIGSAFIPNTAELMTWGITSSAFKMFLSPDVVGAIKENIQHVVTNFLGDNMPQTDLWAIHPGGVKIVEAVQQSLNLTDNNVSDSMSVLKQYGNMSSPTILFILCSMLNKIKANKIENKKIFACAFGPGLNVELLSLSSFNPNDHYIFQHSVKKHAVQKHAFKY